ncbi:MAG: 5,6-dimethylbenzimidazole synthase [candidate division BRC1 bacterium ADurb.BinA364]|nr:MAG: 5,6-dimethylbenzimidazole synthase [candidate division BRC1 bacterium ADurb.BinA364]
MDERLGLIFARRSIRKYASDPVSEKDIQALLEAAAAAPSANNGRPWQFVAVTERTTLDKLGEMHPYGKMLLEAPLCIAVCADASRSPRHWVQDCAAATQNILLAATAMNLGSVWLGCHPNDERKGTARELLGIPNSIEVFSLVCVGYAGERKEPRTQLEPFMVHRERW